MKPRTVKKKTKEKTTNPRYSDYSDQIKKVNNMWLVLPLLLIIDSRAASVYCCWVITVETRVLPGSNPPPGSITLMLAVFMCIQASKPLYISRPIHLPADMLTPPQAALRGLRGSPSTRPNLRTCEPAEYQLSLSWNGLRCFNRCRYSRPTPMLN